MENQYRLLFGATYFALGALYSLLSLYLSDIGFSGSQIGTITAAGSLVLIFSQPFWGMVSDQTKRTIFILKASLVAAGLMALGLIWTKTFITFLILYSVVHFFQGANTPISNTLGIEAAKELDITFGNLRQYGSIGFAVSVLILTQITELTGLWVMFPMYSLAYFIAVIGFRQKEKEDLTVKVEKIPNIMEQLVIKRFWLLLVSSFFVFGPIMANNNYFSLLYDFSGGSVAGIGLAFLLFAGSEAPVMKVSGFLINRFGTETIMVLAALLSAGRWFWYSMAPSPLLMIALFILQGISVGVFIVCSTQAVSDAALPHLKNTAMTLYTSAAIGLGGIVCQFTGGVLFEFSGIQSVYQFFGITTLLGVIVLLYIRNTRSMI